MKSNIYLPKKIKVGYQSRHDTYTKKLAYVIYYDDKNVLRKEKGWQNWRDTKISPDDFNNEPTEGFVLNKGVGGTRESYGWNTRNEYIRVYDPRGFEFEISVANLLYILDNSSSIKGKGLEGKFIYGWEGKELVLIPESSPEFTEMMKFTAMKSVKISAKEMKPGFKYLRKDLKEVTYLGKLDFTQVINGNYNISDNKLQKGYSKEEPWYNLKKLENAKYHVFWNGYGFDLLTSCSNIAEEIEQDDNYLDHLDKLKKEYRFGKHNSIVFGKDKLTFKKVKILKEHINLDNHYPISIKESISHESYYNWGDSQLNIMIDNHEYDIHKSQSYDNLLKKYINNYQINITSIKTEIDNNCLKKTYLNLNKSYNNYIIGKKELFKNLNRKETIDKLLKLEPYTYIITKK